jgi:hypothetical protein
VSVSALYVRADGPYPALVADWWDEARDARLYAGPNPVVAHPPCKRWSRLAHIHGRVGLDGGCFAAALAAVRTWGGVLEHPAESMAWGRFGLLRPTEGCWSRSLLRPDEWVAEVYQRHYGHRAEKRTWLLLVGEPAPLDWSRPAPAERSVECMGHNERELTPEPFARLLVALAASARREAA